MSIAIKAKYKKGLFARKISIDHFMKHIGDINVEGNFGAELIKFNDATFEVRICPNGVIHFQVSESMIQADAVTSIAGPGFHKAAIDVLEALEKKMAITLDYEDPTDYNNTKSFIYLQREHVKDLRHLLETIVGNRTPESLHSDYLAWTNPWYPTGAYEIVTPFGSFTTASIASYLSDSDLTGFAQKYFVWYDEGKTPLYHKQQALYDLWNTYQWRKPNTKEEASTIHSIVRHLEIARMVNPDILLPHDAWQEICANNGIPYLNLNENADEIIPNLGYLKSDVHYVLPMDYGLKTSGRYSYSLDEGAMLLHDVVRTIRIQIVPERNPGQVMDPRRMLERVDFQDEIEGYIYIGQFSEEEIAQGTLYTLQAFVQGSTSYANVTFMYQDPADKDWAMKMLQSLETPYAFPLEFGNLS